ncbi:acyl carrier protein [Streptomyces altiplanensis]
MDHPDNAPPPDELVEYLVGLWREFLGSGDGAPAGPGTNFFVHGGHSLLGITLLARVEESTGCRLRLADLFKSPTPERLAGAMRAADTDLVIPQ